MLRSSAHSFSVPTLHSSLVQDFDDFSATQLLADGEREVTVTRFNSHMAVMCEDGPVLISREQARDFFCFD